MIKTFFLCLFLNLIGMFTLDVLASSAFEMGLTGLAWAYTISAWTLIVASDVMFIKKVYERIRYGRVDSKQV